MKKDKDFSLGVSKFFIKNHFKYRQIFLFFRFSSGNAVKLILKNDLYLLNLSFKRTKLN